MKFNIKEFSIISPSEKKSFNTDFKEGINLIIGEKDSGKSSLARAILYTLGCDVKCFDFINKMPNNIYIIDFTIDLDEYTLIRRRLKDGKGKNYFKIVKNNSYTKKFYSTKEFKDYLNEIMNIDVEAFDKSNNVTKLYPNHIFLPFYTDQDNSWQSYLNNSFDGLKFIKDYKKIILEYFVGARGKDYYRLQLEKKKLNSLYVEIGSLIKSKKSIIKENYNNIKIIENIDFTVFQEQYKYALEMYADVIDKEHDLKHKINELIYRKNSFIEMKMKLTLSIETIIEDIKKNGYSKSHKILDNTIEEDYTLNISQQELIREKEEINMYICDLDKEISRMMYELEEARVECLEFESKLNSDQNTINLIERANSYALNQINTTLEKDILELENKKLKVEKNLEDIENKLSKLNQDNKGENYRKYMISAFDKLNIPLYYKNYYTSNLESVKIDLSGTTKVQAYIAQYLSIYQMSIDNKETIDVPMFIDTFLKDDFNFSEIIRTSEYIFDSLQDKFQSFIFIANNEQTLKSINKYKFNEIKLAVKEKLLDKNYDLIYSKYTKWLQED